MIYLCFSIICLLIFYIGYCITESNKNNNFNFLDLNNTMSLKGVAILLVVFCHLGGKYGIRILTPLGGTGVAIFLIVSGYGLHQSYEKNGLKGFWVKKVIKVIMPYILIQTFVTIVTLQLTTKTVLLDILLIKPTHPLGWYLNYLMMWYLIFYFAFITKVKEKYKIYVIIIISFLLFFVLGEIRAEQSLSFLCGILLSYHKEKNYKPTWKNSIIFLLIGFTFLLFKQMTYVRELPQMALNVVQLLIKFPLGFGIILLSYKIKDYLNHNIFNFLGGISFEIYLIHGYTITMLQKLTFINITLFITLTLVLSIIFKKVIDLINIKFINEKEKVS